MKIKQIARENALRISERVHGGLRSNETGITRLKGLGLSQGTAQRLLSEESDVQVEALEILAKGLRIKPWQLLVPDLKADALPELHPGLSVFSPETVDRLRSQGTAELRRIENAVRQLLDMEALPREGFQAATGAQTPGQRSTASTQAVSRSTPQKQRRA